VIFLAQMSNRNVGLWEASVAGGAPVPVLDSSDTGKPFWGDWSPDGSRFAFMDDQANGRRALKVVRTSGGAHTATPVPSGLAPTVPYWSPDGQWISWQSEDRMWHLISADGQKRRDLAVIDTTNLGFSKDGRTAYGIRDNAGKY
jgi:Tol biopolymer transport system component